MKRFIFILTFILAITTSVFASDISVQINGEMIDFKDEAGNIVEPQIINSRTMVPMRKIFEVLGAEINWDGETRTVTGTKDNVTIVLQIDNLVAKKIVNGVQTNITLDSAPVIINSRTMVPVRFIAESLDKKVGWDNTNRDVIIIDYTYFANELKQNAPALYNFLNNNSSNIEASIIHNFYDLSLNSNTSFNAKINSSKLGNVQNINLSISGTDELSSDIASEGWANSSFSITYNDDSISINTNNQMLSKMFGESTYKTYDELMLQGDANANFAKMFEIWSGVKEEDLNINTFSNLKKDFKALCDIFATSNESNSKLTSKSTNINYNSYKVDYFDLTKLDNFVVDNEFIKAINLVNKIFFKFDIQKDVLLYDTTSIQINFSVDNNVLKINVQTLNDYNEKNEYIIELKHI